MIALIAAKEGCTMRLVILGCLAILCSACGREMNQATANSHPAATRPVVSTPHYWSEAQKNRAMHFWLPQNQLPPGAPVSPAPESTG